MLTTRRIVNRPAGSFVLPLSRPPVPPRLPPRHPLPHRGPCSCLPLNQEYPRLPATTNPPILYVLPDFLGESGYEISSPIRRQT